MALPSSPRNGAKIIWVTLHSAEGARTVGSLYDFFNRGQHASSHAGADGYQLSSPWVPDDRAAWTLLNGNARSLNLELCAFARWTREQWLSTGWVDGVWNPRQMIRHAAAWAREKCDRHGLPRRLLTAAEVGRGMSGIIDHARYTYGTGDGNHTDVGNNFPWDVFFSDLNGTPGGEEEIVDAAQEDRIAAKTVSLLLDGVDLTRTSDPDEGPIGGTFKLRWLAQGMDAKFRYLKAVVTALADDEANILAAIAAQQEQVDLTTEQMQALLAAMSDASKEGLRELLQEGVGE